MTRVRRRTSRRSRRPDDLNFPQLLELTIGPKEGGSAFETDADLRAAWEANRERLLDKYAHTMHDAGWRPEAFWRLDAGVTPEWVDDDWREPQDDPFHDRRLVWLHEHDAFLPGELDRMRRRAKSDPKGYAAAAWEVVRRLEGVE